MRSVAAAGFVALGFGCNSILGLDPTTLQPDAQPPRIQITGQALTAIPDVIEYAPLEGLDKIKLAPMDTPFDDHPCSEQAPPCTQSFDGMGFALPTSLVDQPYRMQYQPVGDIPHEVQWSFTTPHICVPYFGKAGQPAAPSNATVQIMATGGPGTFDSPLVFTYGRTWSAGPTQTSAPNPVDYAFTANATPIEGPLATIQSGTDAAMLVDFTAGAATGGVRFAVDLQADMTVAASGMWQTPPQQQLAFKSVGGNFFGRYVSAIGALAGIQDTTTTVFAGVIPSSAMPPFAITPFEEKLDPLTIPMFALATVAQISHMATFVNPFTGADTLPVGVAFEVTQLRSDTNMPKHWPDLHFGLQWIRLANQIDMNTALDAQDVGLPGNPSLNGKLLKEIDDGPAIDLHGVAVTQLAFTLDQPADHCAATLYEANGNTTWGAIRSYEVTPGVNLAVSIQIDASVFKASTRYVFGIVCRAGFPNAPSMGQFDQISYPFSVSSTYPAVFQIVR